MPPVWWSLWSPFSQTGVPQTFTLPLPAFLLWPIWLLAWLPWAGMWLLRLPQAARLRLFLKCSAHLSGLRLEVETQDGLHIYVRLV